VNFDYAAPSISGLVPPTLPTTGGVLRIDGSNFGMMQRVRTVVVSLADHTHLCALAGSTATVTVGSVTCPWTSRNDTTIVCNMPAGEGTALDTRVRSLPSLALHCLVDHSPLRCNVAHRWPSLARLHLSHRHRRLLILLPL